MSYWQCIRCEYTNCVHFDKVKGELRCKDFRATVSRGGACECFKLHHDIVASEFRGGFKK